MDNRLPWSLSDAEKIFDTETAQRSAAVAGAISGLVNYSAVLWSQEKKDYVLDLRDLVDEMVWVWVPEDYIEPMDGSSLLGTECQRRISNANRSTRKIMPAFSGEQAESIIHGLSVHAGEMSAQGNLLSVWQCCRLAKQLRMDCISQTKHPLVLHGSFTIDESERFINFGCQDRDHIAQGAISGRPVLVFHDPVDVEQIPEGWQCYHLSGRNIRKSDRLSRFIAQENYTGTVLSPVHLTSRKRDSVKIEGQFKLLPGLVSLEEFCKQHGLEQAKLNGLFPETQTQKESSPDMTIGGIK